MPTGIYKHKPRPKKVRKKIRETLKGREFSEAHKIKLRGGKRQTREKNSNWKGGRIMKGKYVYIYQDRGEYIAEHRLVIEKYLGRQLESWEQVHHRNGIKNDNRIENLEIVIRKAHFGQIRCPYCRKDFLIK